MMGTRATVKFYTSKESESPILSVYFQFDGYISGVGHELADFLKSKTIINGISGQTMQGGFANGVGCLAAQYIKAIKTDIGGVYLTQADDEQGYDYKVYQKGKEMRISIDEFDGTPQELLDYNEEG